MSRHAAPRGRRGRPAPPYGAGPPAPEAPGRDAPSGRPPAPDGVRTDPYGLPPARFTDPGHPGDPADGAYERGGAGATRWEAPRPELAAVDAGEARRGHLLAAAVAVAVGLALGGAAVAGRPAVVAVLALVQAALVPAWVLGTARPGRIGGMILGLAAAGGADAALLVRDRTSPAVLLGVLGLAVPALLVHQLTRGVVRVRVTESLAGVAVLVAAEVALATLLALDRAEDGNRLAGTVALAAAAGLAAARLTDAAAPVPRIAAGVPYGLLAVVLAAAAGAAAGTLTAGGPLGTAAGAGVGALVAAVAALVSVGVGFVAVALPGPRHPLALAYLSVVLPLALVAPVGYLTALSVAG